MAGNQLTSNTVAGKVIAAVIESVIGAVQLASTFAPYAVGFITLCWLGYVLYAPHAWPDPQESLPGYSKARQVAVARALVRQIPDLENKTPRGADPLDLFPVLNDTRLVPRAAYNLEIYLPKDKFESVPYPDRDSFVSAVGRAWCDNTGPDSHTYLPSVYFRDFKTGEHLATYGCVQISLRGLLHEH